MATRHQFSTSQLAREIGTYEAKVRRLGEIGVLKPKRDIFGRRIFTEADVLRGRDYLAGRLPK